MLKHYLKMWVAAGIANYPDENVTPVRLTNIIALVIILVSLCQLPSAIWFWQQQGQTQALITLATISTLISIPLINHLNFYITAKILLVVIYTCDLLLTSILWQYNLYIHFFYLLAVVCCPFFFTNREQRIQWSCIFLCCGLFVASEIYYQLYTPNSFSPSEQSFQFASACLLALASLLCSFHIQRNVNRSWQRLADERKRSEQLLLNILPNSIAQRLKHSKNLIADYFAQASILFADIQDFTPLCKKRTPEQLVRILNEIFCSFDELSLQYGLEKIKTSGDGYMAAGGLPKANSKHAIHCCNCALDMLQTFQTISQKHDLNTGLRIGIGCGEVIAGIIGKNKFSYDMWGEAVNLASRMESHGACNKIQTTQSTYDLTKDKFEYSKRGTIEIKGIGPVNTYWLLGRKT